MSNSGERSIATLLEDIVGNVKEILTAEIRLVKVEARQQVNRATRSVALLLAGGAIWILALACVCVAGIELLTLIVAPWVAALIVGAAAGAIGAIFIQVGLRHWRRPFLTQSPTTSTIGEIIQWTKPPAG